MLARTVRIFSLIFQSIFVLFSYDVEIAYAKGLRKSSETFQKIAGRAKG
jgi:hypothetical protein